MKHFPILLAVVMAATAATATPAATRITVTGEGSVAVIPDQATVNASIVTDAPSADAATAQNNTSYARLVAAVTAIGIARDDVTLSYYNLTYNPRPSPAPGEPAPTGRFGYIVNRSFAVKVRAVANAGKVVDALTRAGVTNVDNVSFGLANPAQAQSEAIAKAMRDAQSKAAEIAKAAGLHIVRIGRITLGGSPGIVPMVRMAAMSAPAPPTVFDAGSVNVTSSLTVIFIAQP
ncbi:MAG TPA: SIMPL domain-containing protein [Candidatus Baltobacteraceae bacterium]|nr:SIMPL domain-containing protein [Candidatus Baltobacteraceae bacterium]